MFLHPSPCEPTKVSLPFRPNSCQHINQVSHNTATQDAQYISFPYYLYVPLGNKVLLFWFAQQYMYGIENSKLLELIWFDHLNHISNTAIQDKTNNIKGANTFRHSTLPSFNFFCVAPHTCTCRYMHYCTSSHALYSALMLFFFQGKKKKIVQSQHFFITTCIQFTAYI